MSVRTTDSAANIAAMPPLGSWRIKRTASNDQTHGVFERHDIRCTGSDEFSQAMPDHRIRRDAPGFHELCEGIFNGKQRGLGVVGAVDQRRITVLGKNYVEQTVLKIRFRQSMTAIHGIPKNGVRAIKLRGHAGML